jgi:hypothetical protein
LQKGMVKVGEADLIHWIKIRRLRLSAGEGVAVDR